MKALLTLVGILSILVFATACSKQEEVVSPVDEIPAIEATNTETEQALQDGIEETEEPAEDINTMVNDADASAEPMLQEAEEAMSQEAPEQE